MATQWTWIIGVVFTVIGIWGYLSAPALGVFAVDGAHNFAHLLTGIMSILAALGGEQYAKTFLKVLGVFYAVMFTLGLVGGGKILGTVTTNGADNLLHLVTGAAALYGGFTKGKRLI